MEAREQFDLPKLNCMKELDNKLKTEPLTCLNVIIKIEFVHPIFIIVTPIFLSR